METTFTELKRQNCKYCTVEITEENTSSWKYECKECSDKIDHTGETNLKI